MKNGNEIILKFKWVSGSAVSPALAGSRQSPSWCSGGRGGGGKGGSGCKNPEKFDLFLSGGLINNLKLKKKRAS